jgi:hypothetical protein
VVYRPLLPRAGGGGRAKLVQAELVDDGQDSCIDRAQGASTVTVFHRSGLIIRPRPEKPHLIRTTWTLINRSRLLI